MMNLKYPAINKLLLDMLDEAENHVTNIKAMWMLITRRIKEPKSSWKNLIRIGRSMYSSELVLAIGGLFWAFPHFSWE